MTAALLVRRGWVVGAAVCWGCSAGLEPWGVLAAPLLLHDLRLGSLLRGGTVLALVVSRQYLPFVLTGEFGLFHHIWPLGNGSLAHLVWPGADGFTWYMRAVQGALASGLCARCRAPAPAAPPHPGRVARTGGRRARSPAARPDHVQLLPGAGVPGGHVGAVTSMRASRWPEIVSIAAMIYLPFLSYGALACPASSCR